MQHKMQTNARSRIRIQEDKKKKRFACTRSMHKKSELNWTQPNRDNCRYPNLKDFHKPDLYARTNSKRAQAYRRYLMCVLYVRYAVKL